MTKEKPFCLNCGVEMNHHADKINALILLQTKNALGEDFNGMIEAAYACMICGTTIETALQQTVKGEALKPTFVDSDIKPRTARRLRFTYTGLL